MNGKAAWDVVEALQVSLRDGKHGLSAIPSLVKRIIVEDLWRSFYCEPLRRDVEFLTFEAYVADDLPSGLGTDIQTLKNLCRDYPDSLDAIDAATQTGPGAPPENKNAAKRETETIFDNVQDCSSGQSKAPTGNTRDAALRRLRKDRPDLHAKVLAGDVSPHGAMVQAGFRKKKTPEELVVHHFRKCESRLVPLKVLVEQLDDHERQVVGDWLNGLD